LTKSARSGVYLDMLSADEALARFMRAVADAPVPDPEQIPVTSALGRVTAEPVYAQNPSPHYVAAAMDGFAVKSADTRGASETAPVRLHIPDESRPVNTGDPIPEGFDAVCKVEEAYRPQEDIVEIMRPIAPRADVRSVGEDIKGGELLLTANRVIGPAEIGCLLASGVTNVLVRGHPRVAILPTGSELVQPGAALVPGAVVEYNSPMLASMAAQWGAAPSVAGSVPDDPDRIWRAVEELLANSHLVAVIGGSSAGRGDHVPDVIRRDGQLIVHGVRIAPGKPVALGLIEGKPVIGVPGYPVSAWVAFDLFAKPVIFQMLGISPPERARMRACVRRKIPSRAGIEEFVRVTLAEIGGVWVAVPLKRGAGVLTSLMRASGLLRIPAASEGIDAGQEVDVELLASSENVSATVLGAGDTDPSLDIISTELSRAPAPLTLRWSKASSEGGLLALRRGEAHLAGLTSYNSELDRFDTSPVAAVLQNTQAVAVHVAKWRTEADSHQAGQRFDLVLSGNAHDAERMKRLMDLLRSTALHERLAGLEGCDASETGKVVYKQ